MKIRSMVMFASVPVLPFVALAGDEKERKRETRVLHNNVRMIAFNDEDVLEKLIIKIHELNTIVERDDDKIRLFQVPLDRIV